MVEILRQLIKFKAVWDAIHAPWFGIRLKGTEEHLTRVFLVIRALVRNPQHGHLGKACDRLCHNVEVFTGVQRNIYARHLTHFVAPHACAVDHHVSRDMALLLPVVRDPVDPRDATTLPFHAGDLHPFFDHRTVHPRAFGEGQRNVGGIGLTICRQPDTALHVFQADMLVALFDFSWAQLFHRHVKRAGHSGIAIELLKTIFCQSDRDRPDLAHPGGDFCFFF